MEFTPLKIEKSAESMYFERTKVVDDALGVVGERQRPRRLELQGEVLAQRRDQQELVRLLCDLHVKPKRITLTPLAYSVAL